MSQIVEQFSTASATGYRADTRVSLGDSILSLAPNSQARTVTICQLYRWEGSTLSAQLQA